MDGEDHMTKPEPPPEAVLLRLARKASGVKTLPAAAAAGISKARLSQIESGYERRLGVYKPVRGRDDTVAHLAAFNGVTPEELDEAGRPDAAAVLRVILRRREAAASPPPPSPDHAASDVLDKLEDFIRFSRRGPSERDDGERASNGA